MKAFAELLHHPGRNRPRRQRKSRRWQIYWPLQRRPDAGVGNLLPDREQNRGRSCRPPSCVPGPPKPVRSLPGYSTNATTPGRRCGQDGSAALAGAGPIRHAAGTGGSKERLLPLRGAPRSNKRRLCCKRGTNWITASPLCGTNLSPAFPGGGVPAACYSAPWRKSLVPSRRSSPIASSAIGNRRPTFYGAIALRTRRAGAASHIPFFSPIR